MQLLVDGADCEVPLVRMRQLLVVVSCDSTSHFEKKTVVTYHTTILRFLASDTCVIFHEKSNGIKEKVVSQLFTEIIDKNRIRFDATSRRRGGLRKFPLLD